MEGVEGQAPGVVDARGSLADADESAHGDAGQAKV